MLAEAIDRLVDAGSAYVVEAETKVTVSELSAQNAGDLLTSCHALDWAVRLYDSSNSAWDLASQLDQDFAPFRLTVDKPAAPVGVLRLLSNHEFARYLREGHAASHWQIARLSGPIVAQSRTFESWSSHCMALTVAALTKSPRVLVREFGNERYVPEDIRPWLAIPLDEDLFGTPAAQIWVHAATAALIRCLPDEIDSASGALKFRGPPRLTLAASTDGDAAPSSAAYDTLQAVARWVYETDREAEMRHVLLASEIARSGAPTSGTASFLRVHLADAWESARIAYQMALSDTSRDTLKLLGDLRKAVIGETAKLSDLSRQLTASVAGAIATGIGLVAARIAANAPADLVAAVMFVALLYVMMVIFSGIQSIRLQRRLRAEWQPKLYRFLPESDYARLVDKPVGEAERSFMWMAAIGGIAVLALTIACAWPLWSASLRSG